MNFYTYYEQMCPKCGKMIEVDHHAIYYKCLKCKNIEINIKETINKVIRFKPKDTSNDYISYREPNIQYLLKMYNLEKNILDSKKILSVGPNIFKYNVIIFNNNNSDFLHQILEVNLSSIRRIIFFGFQNDWFNSFLVKFMDQNKSLSSLICLDLRNSLIENSTIEEIKKITFQKGLIRKTEKVDPKTKEYISTIKIIQNKKNQIDYETIIPDPIPTFYLYHLTAPPKSFLKLKFIFK